MKRILILLAVAVTLSSCGYNTLVEEEEQVAQSWAKVETQYQRRLDLIPNLVETVKGYADFEQETLTGVIEARAKASGMTIEAENLTPEAIAKYQEAQQQLSGALSRLLVTVERYPDLKASAQFSQLQAQLEGTENRISVARDNFNETVGTFNTSVKQFPRNITAGIFGFDEKGYFESDSGAENAPQVEF